MVAPSLFSSVKREAWVCRLPTRFLAVIFSTAGCDGHLCTDVHRALRSLHKHGAFSSFRASRVQEKFSDIPFALTREFNRFVKGTRLSGCCLLSLLPDHRSEWPELFSQDSTIHIIRSIVRIAGRKVTVNIIFLMMSKYPRIAGDAK